MVPLPFVAAASRINDYTSSPYPSSISSWRVIFETKFGDRLAKNRISGSEGLLHVTIRISYVDGRPAFKIRTPAMSS